MFWFPSTITHGNKKTGLLVSFFFKKGERAEGEREIENLKQAPCPGVDLNAGLNLTTLRSRSGANLEPWGLPAGDALALGLLP